MQKVVEEVAWSKGVPMCPDKAEIEDTIKIKINQLMDTKELGSAEKEDRSIAMDDAFVMSFSE